MLTSCRALLIEDLLGAFLEKGSILRKPFASEHRADRVHILAQEEGTKLIVGSPYAADRVNLPHPFFLFLRISVCSSDNSHGPWF